MFKEMMQDFIHDKTKVLFSLLILTSVVLPITYSRYISQELGMTPSRTAKWDVKLLGNDNEQLELVLEDNVSSVNYAFEVTSISEVACDYSIKIDGVPNGITLMIDNDNTKIYSPTNGTIEVENVGGFEVNSKNTTNNHILTFIANNGLNVTTGTNLNLQVDIKQRIK